MKYRVIYWIPALGWRDDPQLYATLDEALARRRQLAGWGYYSAHCGEGWPPRLY